MGDFGIKFAYSCEFQKGKNDLENIKNIAETDCLWLCKQKLGCSHLVWTKINSECSMKMGKVSENDAIYNANPNILCAIKI